MLAQPMDVEELGALGRRKGVCPYYAARGAAAAADIVLLPYSALLSQARTSLVPAKNPIQGPKPPGYKYAMGAVNHPESLSPTQYKALELSMHSFQLACLCS